MNKRILNALNTIEEQIKEIRKLVSSDTPKPVKQTKQEKPCTPRKAIDTRSLKLPPPPEWNISDWPEAVPAHLIVGEDASPAEKSFRAIQIIDILDTPLEDKKILDFGCGQGYTTLELLSRNTQSVLGYDIVECPEHWQIPTAFTTYKKVVQANAPYDLIILYDVLDHITNEEPAEVLKWLKSLLDVDGKIFVRCHPWTARHGSHSYEETNKAYIHLVLTQEEMEEAGIKSIPTLQLNRPVAAYESWIKHSGLNIAGRKIHTTDIEPFFNYAENSAIIDRIMKIVWNDSIPLEAALKILRNQFVDYVLESGQGSPTNQTRTVI